MTFVSHRRNFWRQTLALLPVFVNGFLFGCHVQWLSNAAFYLSKPGHVPSASFKEFGYIGSTLELGRILFSFPGGYLVDRWGRKKVVQLGGLFNCISSIMLIFSNDLTLIYIARLVAGMGLSLCVCSAGSIISETSSPEFRGIFVALLELMKRSSIIFQSLLSVIFLSYRSIAIGTSVISLTFFPVTYFLLESPYFLINAGRYEEAKNNFKVLNPDKTESQIDKEFDNVLKSISEEASKNADLNFWQILGQKSIIKAVFLGVFFRSWTILSGFIFINSFFTIIMPENELISNAYYPLIVFTVCTCNQIFWTIIIERVSRRILLLSASSTCALALFFLAVTFYLELAAHNGLWTWTVLCVAVVHLSLHASVVLPIAETVASEVLPVGIKGRISAAAIVIRSTFAMIGFELFHIVADYFGIYGNFYFYGLSVSIFSTVSYFFLPETRGKSLTEVQTDL